MSELDEALSRGMAECRERQERFGPIAGIYVSNHGKSIDLSINTSQNYYSDWIKGEGADICLHRRSDDRVCGAHLPCYAKTLMVCGDNFPPIRIDLASGEVTIEKTSREDSR